MPVYYVNPLVGSDENDGLSMQSPKETHLSIDIKPGDAVLFRRGTEYRCAIESPSGTENAVITYGAYGNGEPPKFYGSVNRSEKYLWRETEKSIWELCLPLGSMPGNIIFNFGAECGEYMFEKSELAKQGQWSFAGASENEYKLYIYSGENPASAYGDIEIALFEKRYIAFAREYVTFEGLAFYNSGVHAVFSKNAKHITVRDCRFENIGGCVWSRERKIRFGNAIEFWDGADDCEINDNYFYNIYDSCFTTQGSEKLTVPRNVKITGNTFNDYGMAAYEIRDRVGINILFEFNVCEGAGKGFAFLGVTGARSSEIYPEPMGFHIFSWRQKNAEEGGSVVIRRNIFRGIPSGGRDIYLGISEAAKAQYTIENNENR